MEPAEASAATPSDSTQRFGQRFGRLPVGFFNELKALITLAWPTSLSILFHYFIQPVSLMFCGHLGKVELASAAMAISVIYITCVSVGRGLAFGGDTFFSQTYGSSNKLKMGVYLQKGLLFGVLCAMVIWAVLINTETILLLLRQDPTVARMAQDYTQFFMPGALAYCWIFTLMRYLLCQNSVLPNLFICIASCGMNAVLHYGLVYQAKMGIQGSAIALAMTYYLVFFLLVAYIWGSGIYRETWPGWSWECLEDWAEFSKVALSSIFMTFIFWFCTEVGTFLAGLLGEADISVFSICFQVEGFAWMIPLGIGGACTARVGQYLGAMQPSGAVSVCRVAIVVQAFVSVVMALLCFFLRYYIPLAFTSDSDIVSYTAHVMPLVSIFVLLEGIGGVGVSIIRGTGRQTLGAVIIFISYYVFALPVGIPLMFATSLKLAGIWWGFILGLVVQNLCLLVFVAKMNWQKEADAAQVRAGLSPSTSSDATDASHDRSTADERTGLLSQPSLQQPVSQPEDIVYFDDQRPPSRLRLLGLRLLVLLGTGLVLGAGVALRLFVHVPQSWVPLCLPTHNSSDASRLLPQSESWFAEETMATSANRTIPWCNETLLSDVGLPLSLAPYYRVWV